MVGYFQDEEGLGDDDGDVVDCDLECVVVGDCDWCVREVVELYVCICVVGDFE